MAYTGFTEARQKANKKYLESLEDIKIRVPKGQRDYYKECAQKLDMSLNELFITAANEKIEREGIQITTGVLKTEEVAENVD